VIWRLLLYLEKVRWKRVAIGAVPVAALVAAGVVFAVLRSGGDAKETSTTTAPAQASTNLYYLRAVAPKVRVRGCSMYIRFTWKPHYHANQYIGAPALITASGSEIAGSYRSRFTAKGMSVDIGPVSLAGGYQVWSARVTSLDGDPPGNDTTIQAAPPRNTECG